MTDAPLRTEWTEAMRRGVTPEPAALRAHLRAVHHDHPGFTEECAGDCRDSAGRTSYEWLVETVDTALRSTVLDLACGSGRLLALCADALPPETRLIGVDMSPDELALAARRLPPGRAELHEGQAQDLDCIASGSVDFALCHWALTLMDPVAPVLGELARVLAPDGRFAAIVDGAMATAPGYEAVHDVIYDHVQKVLPVYGTVDLGDPRIRSANDLEMLARDVFPMARIVIEPSVVSMSGPPAAVAREAAGFFYAAFVLSPEGRDAMLDDLTSLLARTAKGGTALFSMPINRLVVDLA